MSVSTAANQMFGRTQAEVAQEDDPPCGRCEVRGVTVDSEPIRTHKSSFQLAVCSWQGKGLGTNPNPRTESGVPRAMIARSEATRSDAQDALDRRAAERWKLAKRKPPATRRAANNQVTEPLGANTPLLQFLVQLYVIASRNQTSCGPVRKPFYRIPTKKQSLSPTFFRNPAMLPCHASLTGGDG